MRLLYYIYVCCNSLIIFIVLVISRDHHNLEFSCWCSQWIVARRVEHQNDSREIQSELLGKLLHFY